MVDLLAILDSQTNQQAVWHYADLAQALNIDADFAATDQGRYAIRERLKREGRRMSRDTSQPLRARVAGIGSVCIGHWLRSVEGSGWDPRHPVLIDYMRMWSCSDRLSLTGSKPWALFVDKVQPVAHPCLNPGSSHVDVDTWAESRSLLSE